MNWLAENATALFGYLISAGLGTWIFVDKKKQKSEQKQIEATAMAGMQEVYDAFVEDVKGQYEKMNRRIKELEQKVETLQKDRDELQSKYDTLKEEHNVLRTKYDKLKEEVATYEESRKKSPAKAKKNS